MNVLRDIAPVSLIAGLAGAAAVDGLTLAERALGVRTLTPWGVAADIFLAPALARTAAGTVLGLVGTVALSTAVAMIIYGFLRVSGADFAALKGAMAANAVGFVTLGFFAPLLGIAPQIRGDLVTNYTALVNLTVLGLWQGWLIRRMLRSAPGKART